MSADEKMKAAPGQVGRTVGFIGGPDAGTARVIPESVGDMVKGQDNEWVYRIWPFSMPGSKQKLYFAFDAQEHPLKMLFKLWEEYSVVAQIRGGSFGHIRRRDEKLKR